MRKPSPAGAGSNYVVKKIGMKKREMAMVGKKVTFAEAEEEELYQWLGVSIEEKWKSLERLRRTFYRMHGLPFPEKVERVIKKIKNGVGE